MIPTILRFTVLVLIPLSFFLIYFIQPVHGINIQRVESPGGIVAWLVKDKTLPLITLRFAFKTGGTAYDPPQKEGLARMVAALLDEGAGNLNSQKFQLQLEELAARLQFFVSADNFRGLFQTLSKNKDKAFRLLSLAVRKPRLDPIDIERIRAQKIKLLNRKAKDPDTILVRTWYKTIFPMHPYGRQSDGYIVSIKSITPHDLRKFIAKHFLKNSLAVSVVGDITAKELAVTLDRVFGGLPVSAQHKYLPDISPSGAGKINVVQMKIPQSLVMFGVPGVKRKDPDWYASFVMNEILAGGGLSSRLMEEIREKKGLAYSVYSYLNTYDHSEHYIGQVSTKNSRVAETLNIIRNEWHRMANNGVSERELEVAKTYINGAFPLNLDSTKRISRIVLGVQLNNLGIEYLNVRKKLINRVTVSDVKRVAKKLLRPEALTITIVGEPKGINFSF